MSPGLAGRTGFRLGYRALAVALVTLAILDPPVPSAQVMDLVVLVDGSTSVPAAEVDAAWDEIVGAARGLPAGSRVGLIRFGAGTVEEIRDAPPGALTPGPVPRAHILDPTDTDVSAGLRAGLRRIRPGRAAAMALITDGRETVGLAAPLLEEARAAGIGVIARRVEGPAMSAVISGIAAPGYATAGAAFPVVIRTTARQAGEYRLLIEVDGTETAERRLDAGAGVEVETTVRVTVPTGRVAAMSVRLLDNSGRLVDQLSPAAMINIRGPVPVLYVSGGPAILYRSLRAGGWPVEAVAPQALDGMADRLADYPVIVLDDVNAASVRELTWRNLVAAVRESGCGLVVLGGRNSFGSGAYRGSILESVLPVTAEPPDPRGAAAVMFVIDASGSMGRPAPGPDRLDLARRAVLSAAASLFPQDEVGLISFDVEAALLLPLARHPDAAGALAGAWRGTASGGTDPARALALAIGQLESSGVGNRIMVLISDGHLPSSDAADLEARLQGTGIELLAWSIGVNADRTTLETLARRIGGRFSQVENPERLPRLVREEIESRRPSRAEARTAVKVIESLPGLRPDAAPWPDVLGYSLMTARPSAVVYLTATNGDPVLVGGWASAGEVLVLAPGIGPWTAGWLEWPAFPDLAGALVEAVNPHRPPAGLSIDVADRPGAVLVRLEETMPDAPGPATPVEVFVGRPRAGPVLVPAEPVAPGLYEGEVAASGPGRYDVLVRRGGQSARFAHARTAFAESGNGERSALDDWISAGLVRPWHAGVLADLAPRWVRGPLRPWLALAGMIVFLAGISHERRLWEWLGRRFRGRSIDGSGAT